MKFHETILKGAYIIEIEKTDDERGFFARTFDKKSFPNIFGDFHWIIASGIKVSIALILVVIWILILSKLKNWIFKKELNS